MNLNVTMGIQCVHAPNQGARWMEALRFKKPLFVCTIAYTETVRIPGISAAGATPELRELTALADAEFLCFDQPRCMKGLPANPLGPPSPVIITKAALNLAQISFRIVDAGMKRPCDFPVLRVGQGYGRSILTGQAVMCPKKIFEEGYRIGEELSTEADYLILAESVPGGTTTALGLLMALGIDAAGKVSSSMAGNAHQIKIDAVKAGFRAAGISFGELKDNPLDAVKAVGDPMQVAVAGMALGASKKVPVMLGGGSQMAAVLALALQIHHKGDVGGDPERLLMGTTRWVAEDPSADLRGIVAQLGEYAVLVANLNFANSHIPNLRSYEDGLVKEGVGAGAAAIAALLMGVQLDSLVTEIERVYQEASSGN